MIVGRASSQSAAVIRYGRRASLSQLAASTVVSGTRFFDIARFCQRKNNEKRLFHSLHNVARSNTRVYSTPRFLISRSTILQARLKGI